MKFLRTVLLCLCTGLMSVTVFAASRVAVGELSSEEQQQFDAALALSLSEQGSEQTDGGLDEALAASLEQEGIDWSYLPNTQQPIRRFGQENVMENGLVQKGTIFYPRCLNQMGSRCGLHAVLNAHALNQAFAVMIQGQSLSDAGVGEDFITNTNNVVEALLAHQGAELLNVIQHQHHADINWLLTKLNAGTDLDVDEVVQLCTALQLTNVHILGKNPRFHARWSVQDRAQRGWNQGWLNNESPFFLYQEPRTIADFEMNTVTYIRGAMARGERGIYHFICHANGNHWILISLIKEINQEPIFTVLDSVQAPLVSKIGTHQLDAIVYLAYIRNLFAPTVAQAPMAMMMAQAPAKVAGSSAGSRDVSSSLAARSKIGVLSKASATLSVSNQGAPKKSGTTGTSSVSSHAPRSPFSLAALAATVPGKEPVSQVPGKGSSAKTGVTRGVAQQGAGVMPSSASIAVSHRQPVKNAGSTVVRNNVPKGFLSCLAAGMSSNQAASSSHAKRTVVPHAPTKIVTPSAAVPAQEDVPAKGAMPEEAEKCSICLENFLIRPKDFEGSFNETVLPCAHSFHEVCISGWVAKENSEQRLASCPMCRQQI